METGKETRVRQIERLLVFQGMKQCLVCAQEYKLKTAAGNTKVGRRRCWGKSDTTKKKETKGETRVAKEKAQKGERERERKENKGGQGLKIK